MSITGVTSKGIAIWNEIVALLTEAQASGTLTFVKEIIQGTRSDIPNLPVIIMEPAREREVNHTQPLMKRMTLTITIDCWTDNQSFTGQIVGDDNSIGILDFAAAVKNVINTAPDLLKSGNAIMIRFTDTDYIPPTADFPNRCAAITMEIDYLSQMTTR